MLHVEYESSGFPTPGPVANGRGTLVTSWDDLLWSAITVGRPNRQFVFQHGPSSQYEALFRLSLARMAVEQHGTHGRRLYRTPAARSLDPSEKGAINYFLGMTLCKLFAVSLMDAPWLLHLDVYRPALDPVLRGRSRPDLIGLSASHGWLAFESKGRVSPPDSTTKSKAKQQAERCVSVAGVPVSFHIGAITYFKSDVLQFYWCDPVPRDDSPPNAISVDLNESVWRHYYQPAFQLFGSAGQATESLRLPADAGMLVPIPSADIELGIHPVVLKYLIEERWGEARSWCMTHASDLHEAEYKPDGIKVVAGQSWSKPFVDVTQ